MNVFSEILNTEHDHLPKLYIERSLTKTGQLLIGLPLLGGIGLTENLPGGAQIAHARVEGQYDG